MELALYLSSNSSHLGLLLNNLQLVMIIRTFELGRIDMPGQVVTWPNVS
jgi:hypothetical protein